MVLCGRWEVKEGFIDRELFQLPLIEQVGISQIKRKEWAFKKEGMAREKARRHKRNRKNIKRYYPCLQCFFKLENIVFKIKIYYLCEHVIIVLLPL